MTDRPTDDRGYDQNDAAARQRAPMSRDTMDAARARQRDEFGGFNLGAAFFGWLVAVGLGVMLTAIAASAGAALGLAEAADDPTITNASTIGTTGAIVITLIGLVAYFAGGYVAGRMSRFDGARQGLGVWMFGLLMTAIIAAAGAIFGSEYNVLEQLNLPRIPIDEGTLATAGVITLIAVALVTLIGALVGGKTGEGYHRRVDRVATDTDDRVHEQAAYR
ncbi:MAG: hypothetical protein WAP35_02175 [Solirubrobacterales bacterium]